MLDSTEQNTPTAPTLDRRMAHNLLSLLTPRIQEAQALLEAAQVLQAINNAPDTRSVSRAINSGGE